MELRVLRYFLAVAREESITRAADVLHVTQPTLSRQLAQLEEEMGVRRRASLWTWRKSWAKSCSCAARAASA